MQFFMIIVQILAVFMCVRLYSGFNEILSKGLSFTLMFIILLLGESFIFVMMAEWGMGLKVPKAMKLVAYFSMVACFYLIILFLISYILQLIGIYPNFLKHYKFTETIVIIVMALGITVYGYFNAVNTKLKEHLLTTEQPNIDFSLIFISDLHIGAFGIDKDRFDKAVDIINSKNPDIIILGGDIVDKEVSAIKAGGFEKTLSKLKARYGVYAVMGNHEYYRNRIDNVADIYESLGMKVLQDEAVKIPMLNIEIIGLDDKTKPQFGLGNLKPIKSFIKDDGFKVLVSHNPIRQKEVVANGIDLFLAGHTHAGQMYPMQYLLKFMYDTVWGYDVFDKTQVYVSSGLGTWGPPVRVGNDSEIILLKVKSK